MRVPVLLVLPLVLLTSCNDEPDFSPAPNRAKHHGHGTARHGGEIADVGDHLALVELKLDHDAKTLDAWFYEHEGSNVLQLKGAPALRFVRDGVETKVPGVPQGRETPPAHHWRFEHAALAGDPEGMTLLVPYQDATHEVEVHHHH